MKTEFNVPVDSMLEFTEVLTEHELENEILGTTEDNEIIVAVYFEKSKFDAVQELEEMIEQATNEDED